MLRHAVSRRLLLHSAALIGMLGVLLPPASTLGRESLSLEGPSKVIAQGVDLMPTVPVSWRLTQSQAVPADAAAMEPRTLGFSLATVDDVLVSTSEGPLALLHPGQASFHREGAEETRVSTDSTGVDYANIELIVADAAQSSESSDQQAITMAGDGFTAPSGQRELRLNRGTLAYGEHEVLLGTGSTPWLLYVMHGSVDVYADSDDDVTLQAGEAIQLTGSATLETMADDGTIWVAASIGDEVSVAEGTAPVATEQSQAPPETYSLNVTFHDCAIGTDPQDALDCDVSWEPWDFSVGIHRGEQWNLDEFAQEDDGSWTMIALPMDAVIVGWDPGVGYETISSTGVQNGAAGPYVDNSESPAVSIEIFRAPLASQADTGDLLLTLYTCPSGFVPGPDGDFSPCSLTDTPWEGLSFSTDMGGGGDVWTVANDATALGNGQFLLSGLPAGSLYANIDPDGPPGDAYTLVDGAIYSVPDVYMVDIVPGEQVAASLYHSPAKEGKPPAPEVAGTLSIDQIDCPYGTDVEGDRSACLGSSQPWDINVFNIDTGETFSLLGDGYYVSPGQWAIDLPAGTYDIEVLSNENWDIVIVGERPVSTAEGGIDYLTVYSVDRRP